MAWFEFPRSGRGLRMALAVKPGRGYIDLKAEPIQLRPTARRPSVLMAIELATDVLSWRVYEYGGSDVLHVVANTGAGPTNIIVANDKCTAASAGTTIYRKTLRPTLLIAIEQDKIYASPLPANCDNIRHKQAP